MALMYAFLCEESVVWKNILIPFTFPAFFSCIPETVVFNDLSNILI